MNEATVIVGIIVLVLLTGAVIAGVIWKSRRRGMSAASKKKVQTAWQHALSLPDPVRFIMEADKVLDLALSELGFEGPLGEKLKSAGPLFSDINAVWRAHKLRNHLAHEPGAQISQKEAENALRVFENALHDLY